MIVIGKKADKGIDWIHAALALLITALIRDHMRERMPWLTASEMNRFISCSLSAAAAWLLFILPTLWLRRRYLRVEGE